MKQVFVVTMIFAALTLNAQQPPLDSALLDHLAGKWLMQGSVGKQPVTHEFEAEWVLQHHYLRFHEVSREKNDKGEPTLKASDVTTEMVKSWREDNPEVVSAKVTELQGEKLADILAGPVGAHREEHIPPDPSRASRSAVQSTCTPSQGRTKLDGTRMQAA